MAIIFNCPSCGKHFEVGDGLAGKRVRCKVCGEEMRIPGDPPPKPAGRAKDRDRNREKERSPGRSIPRADPAPPRVDVFGFDDLPPPPRGVDLAAGSPRDDPEFSSPWRAPKGGTDPRPIRSKGRDIPEEVDPLPGWLGVLLGIGALFVVLGCGLMFMAGVARGRPGDAIMAALFVPAFACLGVVIANNLKLLFYAGRCGVIHLLAYLIVPCYSLIFIGMHWRATRRCFLAQVAGGVGFYAFLLMGVFAAGSHEQEATAPQAAPRQAQQQAQGRAIRLIVSGVPTQDDAAVISENLREMLDPDGPRFVGSSRAMGEEAYTFEVSPVDDPEGFARRIAFGTVAKVEGDTITVAADPIDAQEVAAHAARRARQEAEREDRAAKGAAEREESRARAQAGHDNIRERAEARHREIREQMEARQREARERMDALQNRIPERRTMPFPGRIPNPRRPPTP